MAYERTVLTAATALLLFAGGVVAGVSNWLPARLWTSAITAAGEIRTYAEAALFAFPNQHTRPRRNTDDGVTILQPEAMQPGVTLVSGLFGQKLGFRLLAPDGTILHEWPVDFFALAPEEMKHRYHALIHGEMMFPNGDIIANLDGRRLVRFDRCGRILWQTPAKPHHSVFLDDRGLVWAPIGAVPVPPDGIVGFPHSVDRIGAFDAGTGAQVAEISLSESFRALDYPGLIQPDPDTADDLLHTNDVEVLSAAMAPAFPMFGAGDILISSRNLHQLWVLDGTSHRIKWTYAGPMRGQHDPDFRPDGKITVFDNRGAGEPAVGNRYLGNLGGSRIIAIDPATGDARVLYASDEANSFYSPFRGKHQVLDNGNILITETDGGRVFEVTAAGRVVWSFTNGWDKDHVGWIMGATRYPDGYAAAAAAPCS
jgi:hypothetical protein